MGWGRLAKGRSKKYIFSLVVLLELFFYPLCYERTLALAHSSSRKNWSTNVLHKISATELGFILASSHIVLSLQMLALETTPKKFHVLCVVQTSKQRRWENVWKFSLSSPQWASLKFINFLKKKPATFTQATLYSIFSF